MTASESEGWLVEALDDAVPIDGVLEAEEDVENSKEPVVCTKIEEKKRTTRPLTSKKKDKFQEMKCIHQKKKRKRCSYMDGAEIRSTLEQSKCFWSEYCDALDGRLSTLELSSEFLADDFVNLGKLGQGSRDFSMVEKCVKRFQPRWKRKYLGNFDAPAVGSPVLLVISYSAIRAMDLVRSLRSFQTKENLICKVFAKHMKMKDQLSALSGQVRIAVGTPSRILKLCDAGAFSFDYLEHVLLDMGKDTKTRSFFDMPEIRNDFFNLFNKYILARMRSRGGPCRICLY